MNEDKNMPTFAAWERIVLDRFARDAYIKLKQQADAIEQLRQDNKDLSKLLREQLNKDDWK